MGKKRPVQNITCSTPFKRLAILRLHNKPKLHIIYHFKAMTLDVIFRAERKCVSY